VATCAVLVEPVDGTTTFLAASVRAVSPGRRKLEVECELAKVSSRKQSASVLQRPKPQAEAANRAQHEFMANIGHEIRTSINAMIGIAEPTLDSKLDAIHAI
jgi:signal transduction histidine kinase